MESRRLWRIAIAVVAAGLALVAVLVLGGRAGGARGPGPAGGTHFAGLFGQDATYEAPPGQPAVTDLNVDRLRDAFNGAAREPRIVLSLSPT